MCDQILTFSDRHAGQTVPASCEPELWLYSQVQNICPYKSQPLLSVHDKSVYAEPQGQESPTIAVI